MSDEKRQLLIEALQGVESSLELRYAPPRVRAEMLADRVIAEGWQWHPPKEPVDPVEEWRTIPSYSYYEMTRAGDIRSKSNQYEPEKFETSIPPCYILQGDGKKVVKSIQSLLKQTFPEEDLT